MTSLGRSPLKPKESSGSSRFPAAGDIAAEIAVDFEARPEVAPGETLTTHAAVATADGSAPVIPPRERKVREPRAINTPRPPKVRTGNHNRMWSIAAGVVGMIGLLSSVVLATGALFVARDAAQASGFFAHLSDLCDALAGPRKDVFTFSGVNADEKQALVGWGLGSMGYLLVGRFAQSILVSRVRD